MGDFTPVGGLIGGLLIGLAVALMMLLDGRLAGISGIVGGLLAPKAGDTGWRVAFIAGLLLGPLAYVLAAGGPATVDVLASPPAVLVGGLLVGFGTRMGSGCTERPRSVRPGALLAALGGRHGGLLRGGYANRVPDQARLLMASGVPRDASGPCLRHRLRPRARHFGDDEPGEGHRLPRCDRELGPYPRLRHGRRVARRRARLPGDPGARAPRSRQEFLPAHEDEARLAPRSLVPPSSASAGASSGSVPDPAVRRRRDRAPRGARVRGRHARRHGPARLAEGILERFAVHLQSAASGYRHQISAKAWREPACYAP